MMQTLIAMRCSEHANEASLISGHRINFGTPRATEIRKDFGLEAAQVICGHENAAITEVYAERDYKLAAEVAYKTG